MSGMLMLFNINVISLRQAIVPNAMLGRVTSTLNVLVNAAFPLGALLGGLFVDRTGNVALLYAVSGILVFLVAFAFLFTPLARAEQYLPQTERS